MRRRAPMLASIVAFGYALLYVPIVSVVVYSFNDSRLVTLWGGFSLRWYASLLEDSKLLEAALLSLRIAFVSATFATALGANREVIPVGLSPRAAKKLPGAIADLSAVDASSLVAIIGVDITEDEGWIATLRTWTRAASRAPSPKRTSTSAAWPSPTR